MQNVPSRKYPAKVLLLGEYTVLLGAQALATPYPTFFGEWKSIAHDLSEKEAFLRYQEHMKKYLIFLKKPENHCTFIDTEKIEADLSSTSFYQSNIPLGYGLGSSGAVTAAIYDRYVLPNLKATTHSKLQMHLSRLESFFHGKSSGIDPMVSYLNSPILKGRKNQIHAVDIPTLPAGWGYELVDAGSPRSTAQWVDLFRQKIKNEGYLTIVQHQLVPHVEHAIHFLIAGQWTSFWEHLSIISVFQRQYFEEMIPDHIKKIWDQPNLTQEKSNMKLCGAGGGGYFLRWKSPENA